MSGRRASGKGENVKLLAPAVAGYKEVITEPMNYHGFGTIMGILVHIRKG